MWLRLLVVSADESTLKDIVEQKQTVETMFFMYVWSLKFVQAMGGGVVR